VRALNKQIDGCLAQQLATIFTNKVAVLDPARALRVTLECLWLRARKEQWLQDSDD
jgi:hypothetical protein